MSACPNIVLLTCHDLGRFLGCYGIASVHTPHIDALAADGVRFSRSFCVAPQCSPSRAAMLTGRYPHANGVLGLVHGGFGWDLHAGERHLAAILRDRAGYRTHQMAIQHETRRITEVGFDEVHRPWPMADEDAGRRCWRDARQACAFFEEQGRAGAGRFGPGEATPFYLQIGFFEPHREPAQPSGFPPTEPDASRGVHIPPYLRDTDAAREELATFQGVVRDVDTAVGRMLESLEASGLAENTLFVFTSDHGVPFPRAKCSLYDPGLEVPLILRWPGGRVAGGTVSDRLISNVDYVPTLCGLLGIDIGGSADRPVQGRSFADAISADVPGDAPRDAVFAEMTYHDYFDPIRAVRTDRYKLIVNFMYNHAFMGPTQQYRPRTEPVMPQDAAESRHPVVEFYDLASDPLERCNLAPQPGGTRAQRPEPAPEHADALAELTARLADHMQRTGDPLIHGVPVAPMHNEALARLGFPPAARTPQGSRSPR